uniref:ATP-dependent helicase ATRX n=1 Tax=Phallusia mammillata TaxID=59560 RepID=A0A6F9D6I9_9ASCI|nr:transcriptional regulator ATRX homolog [Phallusia mammillata]
MSKNGVVTIHPVGLPEDDFVGPEFGCLGTKSQNTSSLSGRYPLRQNVRKVACTVCMRKSYPNLTNHRKHPILKVLTCKECFAFYESGEFAKDENGIDEHCRWCADGGDVLLICDNCTNVFCKQCIEQNCTSETAHRLLISTSFVCFVCDPTPIAAKQLECKKVFQELFKKSRLQEPEKHIPLVKEKVRKPKAKPTPKPNGVHSSLPQSKPSGSPQKVPKLRIQINSSHAPPQVFPDTGHYEIANRWSISEDDSSDDEEDTVQTPKKHTKLNHDHNHKHAVDVFEAERSPRGPNSGKKSSALQTWKVHCKTKMERMCSEVSNLGTQLSTRFDAINKTPWTTFAALKVIQDVKHNSSALLSAVQHMHAEICSIEETFIADRGASGEASTTTKDSEDDSIELTPLSPTKRKILLKRKERESLRRSLSSQSPISNKRKEAQHINLVPTTDTDKENLSEASLSDIFPTKTISSDIDVDNADTTTPTANRNTTPALNESVKKKIPESLVTSSDSDVTNVDDNTKQKTAFSTKPVITPKRNVGIKSKKVSPVQTKVANSKSAKKSDLLLENDDDLFRPISGVHTPSPRKSERSNESKSGSKHSTKKQSLNDSNQDEKSNRDPSKPDRPLVRKNRKLFIDSDDSEEDVEISEDDGDDDDFVQKMPSMDDDSSDSSPDISENSELDRNELAFQQLMKNMADEPEEDDSDSDVEDMLKREKLSRKISNDDKSTDEEPADGHVLRDEKETRSEDGTTHKKTVYLNPLLKVPLSVSDGEMRKPKSDRKRKTPSKPETSTTKKRRKLCIDEALKDDNLSDEDQSILRQVGQGTKGLSVKVMLSDLKHDAKLKHVLENDKPSTSKADVHTKPKSRDTDSTTPSPIPINDAENPSEDSESLIPRSAQNTSKMSTFDDSDFDATCLDSEPDDGEGIKTTDPIADSDIELLESDPPSESEKHEKDKSKAKPSSSSDEEENDFPVFARNRVWAKQKNQTRMEDFIKQEASDNDFKAPTTSKNKKRRRIMVEDSDSDEGPYSPNKKPGRRNIRKIIENDFLSQETQEAERLENERVKRMEEQDDDLEEEVIIVEDDSSPMKKKITTTRLILSKDPLVEVDSTLVNKLKPHQVEGVKFMWKNVIETVAIANKRSGDGCILAHCMGLGKTFQVVTLLHTLLNTSHLPKLKSALILCPLGIVTNWSREFSMWTSSCRRRTKTYDLPQNSSSYSRSIEVKKWHKLGGVMIVSYGLFKALCQGKGSNRDRYRETFNECLISPGPDLIVCDEGHIIKNSKTNLSALVGQVKTRRRIVLTGTPLQNNLMEYHCMVSFIKPRLLGNSAEFSNRFANPIRNGQHVDSTKTDVQLMKKRSHILHKLLAGCVQRKDVGCLSQLLKPKVEYVLLVRLSPLQIRLYEAYLQRCSEMHNAKECLFQNFNNLLMVVCHPRILHLAKARRDKREDLQSLQKMINDDSEEEESVNEDEVDGDGSEKDGSTALQSALERVPSMSIQELKKLISEKGGDLRGVKEKTDLINLAKSLLKPISAPPSSWFESVMPTQDQLYRSIEHSGKIVLLLEILNQAALVRDKVVVFSQSLLTLNLIEEILKDVTKEREQDRRTRISSSHGRWYKNVDYYRIDGSTNASHRKKYIEQFNNTRDHRGRLFLISTKAGGIGVNLVGANRAVVFDACWNPTHDLQSIFRIYRFGQEKNCYVYRLIAQGTMEEKIYDRQVVKQSLAYRVIDEQQIERHFTAEDISELYTFKPDKLDNKSIEKLRQQLPPKDELLADLLEQRNTRDAIVSYHEHESLLDHQVEEELSEAERRLAWDEYDRERHPLVTPDNPLFKLGFMDLQNLIVLAEAELKSNTEMLDKCKDEELHLTMLKLKACDPMMDADRVQAAAVRVQMRRLLLKEQLEKTRRFILQKLEQLRFCSARKLPQSSSNYTHPCASTNPQIKTTGNFRPMAPTAASRYGFPAYRPQRQAPPQTTSSSSHNANYYNYRQQRPNAPTSSFSARTGSSAGFTQAPNNLSGASGTSRTNSGFSYSFRPQAVPNNRGRAPGNVRPPYF